MDAIKPKQGRTGFVAPARSRRLKFARGRCRRGRGEKRFGFRIQAAASPEGREIGSEFRLSRFVFNAMWNIPKMVVYNAYPSENRKDAIEKAHEEEFE